MKHPTTRRKTFNRRRMLIGSWVKAKILSAIPEGI
jgi:hypothetical protein